MRPLCDDESNNPSAVTRDYTLALSFDSTHAPLLSVFGGKLTTYRKLAEAAMDQLKPFFNNMKKEWTALALLPGAEQLNSVDELQAQIQQQIKGIADEIAARWAHAYGTRAMQFLKHSNSIHELGQDFGHGLFAQEVDYLVDQEWAITSEDILKRRSKLYLDFSAEEILVLDSYLQALHERRLQQNVA